MENGKRVRRTLIFMFITTINLPESRGRALAFLHSFQLSAVAASCEAASASYSRTVPGYALNQLFNRKHKMKMSKIFKIPLENFRANCDYK